MDEEIEDLVGDVKYTDSQKSVATSNVYSLDFTDSSSDKNNSSSKETYVIELDESDDSETTFHLHGNQSVINLRDVSKQRTPSNMNIQYETINKISKATSATFHTCSIAQEIFTQTSKTIIELAETEGAIRKAIDNKTLETQTSFISISENKTVEYRIHVTEAHAEFARHVDNHVNNANNVCSISRNQIICNSLDDGSSKFPISESENDRTDDTKSDNSNSSNNDEVIKIVDDKDVKESDYSENKEEYGDSSPFEKSDTDIDEDSLMCNEYIEGNKNYKGDNTSDTSEVPKSIDSDVEDLYKKLSEKMCINVERTCEQDLGPRFNTLSPLTEESERVPTKKESILDITPDCSNISDLKDDDKYLLFTNSTGIKVKALPNEETRNDRENFKLPPIKSNQSCPTSPHLNFLFSGNTQRSNSHKPREWGVGDRWEIGTKDLAAGESPLISGRSDPARKPDALQLPPIHAEGHPKQNIPQTTNTSEVKGPQCLKKPETFLARVNESISIKDKITELKMSNNSLKHWPSGKHNVTTSESKTSRSASPGSVSPDESRLGDIAERGCDALCVELLRRLRSASWFEIADTLEEIPRVMEKFWGIIPEHRIADLIRQVSGHVESPRTQVARSACHTLASVLKNTNYTKKPDFYEAVTTLLVKTGSFSRPVRRAANVALDGIVCGVELTHAVTALCIHGVGHKSPLVRCAAARLLVVCCALAGGGRDLLRTRPPSAVCARRHALRALAALLEDKSTDTRKYAERLYSMLRPLANFEAFYLTDVEVEVAARQMKRFDQLLLCGPPKDAR
ncbi:uncharacterized protein LOC114353398 [Ostrinia furnacalis]|uniref:uncharacterized protein LOC114353398 n=1 Tax=Ostrinia furnacalis TaxID=93504 RepID=UPI00103CB3C8|nr:uncharacterized protein LOC114353398 [Ostrinia furnacalis]